jgi:hypothetical protein
MAGLNPSALTPNRQNEKATNERRTNLVYIFTRRLPNTVDERMDDIDLGNPILFIASKNLAPATVHYFVVWTRQRRRFADNAFV